MLPGRSVPVLTEMDVVVAGGGFPGVCAALAASRIGATVAIFERDGMLGGQAAAIYNFGLSAYIDNNGKQYVAGIPWEIVQKTIAEGQSDPMWHMVDFQRMEKDGIDAEMRRFDFTTHNMPSGYKCTTYVDPNAFRYVLQNMADKEGITTYLETPLSDVLLDDRLIKGIVVMGSYGPLAVKSKTVVDTTPHAAVAALAGVPFAYPQIYAGTHPRVAGIDIHRFLAYIVENLDDVEISGIETYDLDFLEHHIEMGKGFLIRGFGKLRAKAVREDPVYELTGYGPDSSSVFFYEREGCGTYWIHSSPELRQSSLDDPLHLSQTIAHFRKKQWVSHKLFREYVPGFEKAHLMDPYPHIDRALLRSKDPSEFTEYDIPWEHIETDGNCYEDSVARVMGHHDSGAATEGWQVPYRSLIPKELEGILVTGKPACRWLHTHGTHAAVGQAAGVAAALAAKEGCTLRELDVSKIQRELQRQAAIVF